MIGPLEFNGVVQRAQDISIIKQNEDIKPQYEHMNVQNQQQQKSIIKHENVNKKDNADAKENKFDAKEEGNGTYYRRQYNKKKKEDEDGTVVRKQSGSFDITVWATLYKKCVKKYLINHIIWEMKWTEIKSCKTKSNEISECQEAEEVLKWQEWKFFS